MLVGENRLTVPGNAYIKYQFTEDENSRKIFEQLVIL